MKTAKKQIKKDLYTKCFREFKSKCKKDGILKNELLHIDLLGSAVVKEQIPKWSDLDILLIIKCDKFGNINIDTLKILKEITENLTTKYKIDISVLTHTINDFKNYVSFGYLRHYYLLIKKSNRKLAKYIKNILIRRKISDTILKRYNIYHIRHLRFNLIRKFVSIDSKHQKNLAKLSIEKLFEACDYFLNFFDIWPVTKKDIVKTIKLRFRSSLNIFVIEKAFELRERWPDIQDKEIKKIIPEILSTINIMTSYLIMSYSESTPEESI